MNEKDEIYQLSRDHESNFFLMNQDTHNTPENEFDL